MTTRKAERLGDRIRRVRHRRRLTLEAVAQKVGVTKSYMSWVETNQGEPSLGNLRKIAKALEVKAGRLLGES
ncbi:MAG TPA: helix-turn-helix transcriptional regulator [Spirochaetia bacterium]|nr:helix-turn-helix transcriptional regulator [Spirochaetia bacterium]